MKRKISITMGLSLVAVFAIIATLGLMSLNTDNTVEAADPVAGVTPVGLTFSFSAPTGGLDNDDIMYLRLPKYGLEALNVSPNTGTAPNITVGTVQVMAAGSQISGYSAARGTDPNDDSIAVEFTAEPAISAGTSIEIRIIKGTSADTPQGANVLSPPMEGTYTATVDIQKSDAAISNVASDYVAVQNMVTVAPNATTPTMSIHTLGESKEDLPSKMITVMFTTNANSGGLSADDMDSISIMLSDFQIPASIAEENVTISDGTNTAGPSSVMVDGDVVTLGVPDMSSSTLRTQHIGRNAAGEGVATTVTVTFKEEAGIMNPTNGGAYSVKVHTSKSTMPSVQMQAVEDDDTTADVDESEVEIKLRITPTTPDIARVSLGNDVSGEYTGSMTVRFVTDADLSAAVAAVGGENPTPAVPADAITLKLGEMMNGEYSGFGLPEADFFPPNSVLVNGHNVASPDVDSDNGIVKVAMPTDAAATDSVSVTFLAATGIMNPTLPVTDPATEM
jgi:hypothetical protein